MLASANSGPPESPWPITLWDVTRIRVNWKECAAVETVPGRLSGAPVIKGSRVRPEDLIVNRAEGQAWLAENYELPIETVR